MLAMTSDFHKESRKREEIKVTLARIARAGFTHVHWCHEWTGYYLYSVHEMLEIREWCDELGLKVKGVHATAGEYNADLKDYTSPNEYSRLAGVELIKNRVDLAHTLNAETIVLHYKLQEQDFRYALRSFDELEPYCKTRRIKICIENTEGPPDFVRGLFDTLYKRYDRDYMGLCFDTGHAFLYCKENCLEYAERYNDRLFMMHIHDNNGKGDDHLLPFAGGFDWEGFAPVLARSPYSFPVLVESQCKEEGDDTAWLEKAFEAGRRFSAMVEKYR
jgi:sugar phosphate isomerase/epimerase